VASGSSPVPCYKPLKAFRSVEKHDGSGKPVLTFNPLKAINSALPITLPCGGCIGCRSDRTEEWALRCMHESQMHEYNSFITLTYDQQHLPENYSVDRRTLQLFMKRLRKSLTCKIRFYGCGEYGEQTLRPHYHALIFGYGFPDRKLFERRDTGNLFTSEQLSQSWPYGRALLGDVTYESAAYVAGYVRKKITGDMAAAHYLRTHPVSGLTFQVEPEFSGQSTAPGIGSAWFDKFRTDCFPSDFLVIEGRQVGVPRYYSLKLEELELKKILAKRKLRAAHPKQKANRTKERLAVREAIKADRLSRLPRNNFKDDQ
jgi:hypothetical protein